MGYLFISLFNVAALYCVYAFTSCVLLLYFGFCFLLMSFPVDVRQNLNEIEGKIKSSISQKGKLTMAEQIEIKKNVCDIIQFHGDAKQLSKTKIVQSLIQQSSPSILSILFY